MWSVGKSTTPGWNELTLPIRHLLCDQVAARLPPGFCTFAPHFVIWRQQHSSGNAVTPNLAWGDLFKFWPSRSHQFFSGNRISSSPPSPKLTFAQFDIAIAKVEMSFVRIESERHAPVASAHNVSCGSTSSIGTAIRFLIQKAPRRVNASAWSLILAQIFL